MKDLCRGLAVFLGVPLLNYLGESMSTWSAPRCLGPASLLIVEAANITVFLVLFGLLAVPVLLCLSLWNWRKPEVWLGNLMGVLGIVGFCFLYFHGLGLGAEQRDRGFARAADDAVPLIDALERFKAEHGDYPQRLTQLAPHYLPAIPGTGLIGYPEFSYRKGPGRLDEPAFDYELRIDCAHGMLNFDRFMYWPARNYPPRIEGNGVERIGDWAYVHE